MTSQFRGGEKTKAQRNTTLIVTITFRIILKHIHDFTLVVRLQNNVKLIDKAYNKPKTTKSFVINPLDVAVHKQQHRFLRIKIYHQTLNSFLRCNYSYGRKIYAHIFII